MRTELRAIRGGSWNFEPARVRSDLRTGSRPDDRNGDLGFRLVAEEQEQMPEEPEGSSFKSLRGGSWDDLQDYSGAGSSWSRVDYRYHDVGFRLVAEE